LVGHRIPNSAVEAAGRAQAATYQTTDNSTRSQSHSLVHHQALDERSRCGAPVKSLTAKRHTGCTIEEGSGTDRSVQLKARRGPAPPAIGTRPARRRPSQYYFLTYPSRIDLASDRLDHAGTFMAEHHGCRTFPFPSN